MITAPITVAIHTAGTDAHSALVADVRHGLSRTPKQLPPRWFYDARGSDLFDRITELDEYYQTRTETAIIERWAGELLAAAAPQAVVELGAGSCVKSRLLIAAARRAGALETFVPFDVSESTVQRCARELVAEFPGLSVFGIVGDFSAHMPNIPRLGRQTIAFLGSTIGNLDGGERAAFLATVRSLLHRGDTFLLGIDLVKDRQTLVRAYDDAAGVTAEFNRNVLAVIDRELGADFDLDAFEHVALWNEPEHRIEMHLRSRVAQTVSIPGAGMRVTFEAGETVRTEISVKFTEELVRAELGAARMRVVRWCTDDARRFALALAEPV